MDLLKGLTKGELAPLADAVEPLNFEDGQVVIQEGDKDRANFKFYFVESGEAQAFINKDGDAILMSTLGEGDYFGEKALVEKTPRTATVKVRTEGRPASSPVSFATAHFFFCHGLRRLPVRSSVRPSALLPLSVSWDLARTCSRRERAQHTPA